MKKLLILLIVLILGAVLFFVVKSGSDAAGNITPAGERKVLEVDGIEYAFRWCPPGSFRMGGAPYQVHKVKLTKGFWLLETEVTQEMWASVMGENPSEFEDDHNPVEHVSWADSQEFCQKLSQKLGQTVKLPTEAQWEYACRAGSKADYAGELDEMGWYDRNSEDHPHEVAQKKPNAWGLYDMHGNVWEWCSDWFENDFYAKSPASDPENTTESSARVLRGGGWYDYSESCRSAYRFYDPGNVDASHGLRVVLIPDQD